MTVVDTSTGEIIEPLSQQEAERITQRISLRLDTIADNYTAVMPMIREAISREAHAALGYRSVGEYISDRFGDALGKLGVEVRREVVRELSSAGLSTRAIAPVVGVSQPMVVKDRAAVAGDNRVITSPEPQAPVASIPQGEPVSRDEATGQTPQAEDAAALRPSSDAQPPRPADKPEPRVVTGIDGKRYTQPTEPPKPRRKAESHLVRLDAISQYVRVAREGMLDDLTVLDASVTNEEAARLADDLSKSYTAIGRVVRLLKARADQQNTTTEG